MLVLRSRRFGGAVASFSWRMSEIERRMAQDPSMLIHLVRNLGDCGRHNMMMQLMSLGLEQHPQILLSGGFVSHKLAILVTYHMDAHSQLRVDEGDKVAMQKADRCRASMLRALRAGQAVQRVLQSRAALAEDPIARLRAVLLREHERATSSNTLVYSVHLRQGHGLTPLLAGLEVQPAQPGPGLLPKQDLDIEMDVCTTLVEGSSSSRGMIIADVTAAGSKTLWH